jgi:hypothetical protein
VTLHPYGAATNIDQTVSLTIPAGTDLSHGRLYASSPYTGIYDDPYGFGYDMGDSSASGPPQSLGDVVGAINAQPDTGALLVAFDSPNDESDSSYYDYSYYYPWSSGAIMASAESGKVLQGEADKSVAQLVMQASKHQVKLNGGAQLSGMLMGPNAAATIDIYRQLAGTTIKTLIAQVPAAYMSLPGGGPGICLFDYPLTNLRRTATYTASWDGDATHIGASAHALIKVKARVSLTASVRAAQMVWLTAHVTPAQSGVSIRFERLVGSRWQTLARVPLNAAGNATLTWQAPVGSYSVRAIFPGSSSNVSAASHTRVVVVH